MLRVEGVSSGYGKMMILQGVSIQVEEGELVTIIGPNGSGKSTLLKTIFGIIKPREGIITFAGEDITGLDADHLVRKGIGYVPQLDNVFPSLTVQENLEMGAYTVEKSQRKRVIAEVLELFPLLKEKRHTKALSLSGGERQMLAIARALTCHPRLLLLDEPTAALAPNLADRILTKIREIVDSGTSVLLVEQNARKSLQASNRGYVMAMGRVVFEGVASEILKDETISRLYLGRKGE